MPTHEISKYAAIKEFPTLGPEATEILLFDVPGTESSLPPEDKKVSGCIEVPDGGAIIRFIPVLAQKTAWVFHGLTIHPVRGLDGALDLKWTVRDKSVYLNHATTHRGAKYSYTLAIKHDDTIVYLDPQMIDPAGPVPTE